MLKKLGNVAKVTTGQSAPQDENAFGVSGTPFVRAGSLQKLLSGAEENSLELIDDSSARKYKLKLFPVDTILFAKSGMSAKLGRVYRLKSPCYAVSHLAAILPSRDVDPGFLLRWLEANPPSRLIANDAYPSIKTSEIERIKIPLPSMPEQKRIAAILDKADSIRRKRQQAIQLADDFLRSVFLDMFGDPVTNPKGWEVKLLGELVDSGPTNGLYKPSTEYGAGIRILRIDGFYNGVLSPQEKLKRVNLGQKEIEKYQLRNRGIVINRVNSREYLGKSAFVERLEEVTVFESNMMHFSVNEEIINPCFLVHQLQTPFIKNQVLKLAKDAVNQSSINQQDVKSLEVIVPNLQLQKKFELVCKRYKDSLTTREESLSNCEAIFSSLSQRAFSGLL